MCSIIGSYDPEQLKLLVELNQHRGNFSYSISMFDEDGITINKEFGDFDFDAVKVADPNDYILCHVQAPTGGLVKDRDRIHPIRYDNSLLWHNGILTDAGIKYLQEATKSTETFDTYLLVKALELFGIDILSKVEGLFSCVWKNNENEFFVFRTKHGKLYVDDFLSISSERFANSRCINSDTVYRINWNQKKLEVTTHFKTMMYNFIIKGEM